MYRCALLHLFVYFHPAFSTHFNQIQRSLGFISKQPRKLNVLSEKVIDLRMLLFSERKTGKKSNTHTHTYTHKGG